MYRVQFGWLCDIVVKQRCVRKGFDIIPLAFLFLVAATKKGIIF